MIVNNLKLEKYNKGIKKLLNKRIEDLNFKEVLNLYNFF
jgi:hypothetical protein